MGTTVPTRSCRGHTSCKATYEHVLEAQLFIFGGEGEGGHLLADLWEVRSASASGTPMASMWAMPGYGTNLAMYNVYMIMSQQTKTASACLSCNRLWQHVPVGLQRQCL